MQDNFDDLNLEDVDYLTYVDSLLSRIDDLQTRLDTISYTKVTPVPTAKKGRPLKFGKSTRVFSVRLPVDFVSMLIESSLRENLPPSDYILKYLPLY